MNPNSNDRLSPEEATQAVLKGSGHLKVAVSVAVAGHQACLMDMAERLFSEVVERGWSFDADGQWRRIEEVGSHRSAPEMARLFVEALVVRKDRTVVKAIERKAHEVVPEARRIKMLVEVLYAHGGGVKASGEVVHPVS